MTWRNLLMFGLTLALAPAADAAVTVLGGSHAQDCFEAAEAGKSDDSAMLSCDIALNTEAMAPADRGGTLVNRGVMRLRRREFGAAQADLDAGVALIPKVGELWVNRGAMFIGLRRYREALDDINKAISLGVHEPAKAYFNRGVAHEGLDDETSAYLDYQQALVLHPGWDLPTKELLRFTVTRR